jgi:hypothetical protein
MPTNLSPQEAGALLADIETARGQMRRVIREHRGHYYLWIWGAAWIAMPLTAQLGGDHAAHFFPWICGLGGILSVLVGISQNRQIRRPTSGRLVAVMVAIWGFAALFPFVLRAPPDVRTLYAYGCLIAMQTYVVAGLWTDTYLLWIGLTVTALILAGVFLFPTLFWIWMAVFGGGTLLLTGFYVRHFWR